MKRLVAALAFAACTPPCPDTYPFCIEASTDGGVCRAWPAGCCMGIAACSRGTMIDYDAGACSVIDVPAERKISCQ